MLPFTLYKAKNKSRSGLPASFFAWFMKKNISHVIFWTNFIAWFPALLEILGILCDVIICFSVRDVINFEINLSFIIKPFSYMTKQEFSKQFN